MSRLDGASEHPEGMHVNSRGSRRSRTPGSDGPRKSSTLKGSSAVAPRTQALQAWRFSRHHVIRGYASASPSPLLRSTLSGWQDREAQHSLWSDIQCTARANRAKLNFLLSTLGADVRPRK